MRYDNKQVPATQYDYHSVLLWLHEPCINLDPIPYII